MKLLIIERSRITTLFERVRSSGQLYLPHAASQLAERYSFFGVPRTLEDLGGGKLEFKHGLFEGNAIETLDVYNDGVIVSSQSNTDFLDKFLDDLSVWSENYLGLSAIKTHTVEKIFESVLVVEFDREVLKPLNAYANIARMVEKALQDSSKLEVSYQNFSMAFSADQTKNPALKPIPFRFERRVGIEFALNQFYTTAPLKTKQHLEILEALERLT